jgi:hypothetical protein
MTRQPHLNAEPDEIYVALDPTGPGLPGDHRLAPT